MASRILSVLRTRDDAQLAQLESYKRDDMRPTIIGTTVLSMVLIIASVWLRLRTCTLLKVRPRVDDYLMVVGAVSASRA
jgi:hypothetical protein